MFTMLAGIGTGAAVVHGLHAQAKPPVYYISEIEVTNLDAYMNEYVPKTQAVIQAAGGRVVAGLEEHGRTSGVAGFGCPQRN